MKLQSGRRAYRGYSRVDGACRYCIAGYFDTKKDAIQEASRAIVDAKKSGDRPSWLI